MCRTATRGFMLTNGAAKGYNDFRELLDRKDIDAVIVATPDHWHMIPMIMACQAGKDVYQEKPLSHTLVEGRHMVEAATRYQRVVQVGTQQRSGEHFMKAVELVRTGKIGKVTLAETWIHGNQYPEGLECPPDSEAPPWFDYNLWLGPAPCAALQPGSHAWHFPLVLGLFRRHPDRLGHALA